MDIEQVHNEVSYKAVTSSGPGGQHVNKVATKVVLEWNVRETKALTAREHAQVLLLLSNKMTSDGRLIISCQESRSQSKNKELAFKKLVDLLDKSSKPVKKRLKRTTPAAVKRKRLNDKKKQGEKKSNRNFRL
jgi:ribosome-associated protein